MSELFVGIDLGGTNIKIGLFDSAMGRIGKTSVSTQADMGPEVVIDKMAETVQKLIADSGVSSDDVAAVGIGTPGPAKYSEGIIIKSTNMPTFKNVPICRMLNERLGKPIVFDKYGDGATPVVAGKGQVENTIRLHNQHDWEIRNLTVTNTDGGGWDDQGRTIRRAVYITAEDSGDVKHIHLNNLEIRDVRGMYRFEGNTTNGGIICQVLGEKKPTRFVDLRMEGCVFRTKSIDRYPVVVTSSWGKQAPGEEIDEYTARTFINFLNNWNEEMNFYFRGDRSNWNAKHNNGSPMFMAHLMLDLPVMRASSIYNWRKTPVVTRDKKGKIKRNKVIYWTRGFGFQG